MTDKERVERAENEHLKIELKQLATSITASARNLEAAVKTGAYDEADLSRLYEIIRLADLVLSRGRLFIN